MDVRLSPEQAALRDSVAHVVGRLGPATVRDLDDVERTAKLDAAVAAAGWRDLRAAGDDGAPWASAVEVAIVAEELARGLADVAFVGPTLAAELRSAVGAGVPGGPGATTTVALAGDLGALGDVLAFDAAGASVALAVRGPDVGEVRVGDVLPVVDLTRPSAAVDTATWTPVGTLPADALTRATALGVALSCADLVGVMRGAVELATAYAKDRRQYGASIGSYQAVQHLLADAFVSTEGSHSVALHAAWAVDARSPAEALAAGSVAKAYCARAARDVCETVIQVHGGIGNTWEHLAHVFLRRALLSTDVLGGVGRSLARVLEDRGIGGRDGFR